LMILAGVAPAQIALIYFGKPWRVDARKAT
jgi:hypothetical protein